MVRKHCRWRGPLLQTVITLDVNMPEMDGITCLKPDHGRMSKARCDGLVDYGEGAEVTLPGTEPRRVDFIPKPTGTVSLHIDKIKVALVAKVRGARGHVSARPVDFSIGSATAPSRWRT